MGFLRNGTVGHGPRLETLDDFRGRLDFIQRNPFGLVEFEIHQSAKGVKITGLVVYRVRIFPEDLIVTKPSCFLQLVNGGRIEEMLLSA